MPPTPDTKPSKQDEAEIREEMAAKYGWAISFLKANPELWRLFMKAVEGEWDTSKFVAQLRSTKWYKTHSDTQRKNAVLQKTDPATYRRRLEQKVAQIQDMSVQLTGVYLNNGQARLVAKNAMDFEWDDSQLRNTLSHYLKQVRGSTHYGGEAGTAEQELLQYAADQGVTLSSPTVKKWLKGIVAQRNTLQDYKAWIQGQAESSYSGLSSEIRAGKTVRQLADPYIQEYASILEENPVGVNLKNPLIAGALQWQNPDGKTGLMSLGAFRQQLKRDPRYLKTKAARDTVTDVGNSILKDFGLM